MRSLYSATLTVTAHISKLAMGFFILKLIAHYLGPEGLGKLGHFMSLLTVVSVLAGGGILHGIIKYVAEYKEYPLRLAHFISAAAGYSTMFAVIFFVISIIAAKPVSNFVFGSESYYPYVIILGVAHFGFSYTNIIIAVCNGLGRSLIYAKIQVAGSLLALPVAWVLIANYGFSGAILSLIASVFMVFFPALLYANKCELSPILGLSVPSPGDFKKFLSFTTMLLCSAIAFPLVEMLIREHLLKTSGYYEVGFWQASTRLSSAYAGLFSVFLGYWFMPVISAEQCWVRIRSKAFHVLAFTMVAFVIGATIFYLWRGFFITILLSQDFLKLESIILYQLVGDFFKISAYVIGFVAVAKAATALYILAEFVQSILFVSLAAWLVDVYPGAKGVMIGYAAAYFFYFAICLISFLLVSRRLIKGNNKC